MKIRFVRPLPRIDHVIPAGFILDAPDGFAQKMIRTGRAVPVFEGGKAPTLEETDRRKEIPPEKEFPDPFAETETEEKETVMEPEEEAAAPAPPASPDAPEAAKKPARARKGS